MHSYPRLVNVENRILAAITVASFILSAGSIAFIVAMCHADHHVEQVQTESVTSPVLVP